MTKYYLTAGVRQKRNAVAIGAGVIGSAALGWLGSEIFHSYTDPDYSEEFENLLENDKEIIKQVNEESIHTRNVLKVMKKHLIVHFDESQKTFDSIEATLCMLSQNSQFVLDKLFALKMVEVSVQKLNNLIHNLHANHLDKGSHLQKTF